MKRIPLWLLAISLACPAAAFARLPAPTPEEAARTGADAEKKALSEEAAKQALARAQDRVARRYRAAHPDAPRPVPVAAPAPAGK